VPGGNIEWPWREWRCYHPRVHPLRGRSRRGGPTQLPGAEADPVQIFVSAIQHPIQYLIAGIIAGGFVLVFLRAAMSPERRSGSIGWIRALTSPSSRYLFAILAVAWAIGFGLLIPQFENTAASPYGAVALIALFSGFFIMMGLLWSVIGE
jgi:CBS-domain-containing membrane protein